MSLKTSTVDRKAFERGRVPIELSGWLPATPLPTYAALNGDIETDILVIGAGLAGGSTFLHLIEAGANAVLIEAKQPANGASGRNAGHYLPYLGDVETFKKWGGGKGDQFFDFAVANRNIAYEISDKYGLDADCRQLGMINAAHRRIPGLDKQARFWRQHGYTVDEVGGQELAELLGTDHYSYGQVWREGGRVNPYLFTNGMVSAAQRMGGRVYGDSPALSCSREGSRWRVRTPVGSVLARKVVVCTAGYENTPFLPELDRGSYPLVASALATRPLPPELAQKLIPSGAVVEQYPGLYHMLLDRTNRLISSTIPSVGKVHDASLYFSIFKQWLNKAFPVSRDFEIELDAYWSGIMFNTTPVNHKDYASVHDLGDGLYAFLDLGSWGNYVGPMLGKSLGQVLAADRPDDFVMPFRAPKRRMWPGQFAFGVQRIGVPALRIADRLKLV